MTPRSPFARRIRLALLRNGIDHTPQETDVFNPTADFLEANPLGLVPVLTDDSGAHPIPDSNTILEVLHERHGRIWPQDPELRLPVRISATLATGIMHATVQYFLESKRPSPSAEWLAEYLETVQRGIARSAQLLERERQHGFTLGAEFSQAGWDLAVALEYLDFRIPNFRWRDEHPSLLPILAQAKRDPFFSETGPIPN